MVDTFKIDIFGLEEVSTYFSKDTNTKAIAKGLHAASSHLTTALHKSINDRYDRKINVDGARVGRSRSAITTGKNLMSVGLVYKQRYFNIGRFPTQARWGNINPATRKGLVHATTIVRGRRRTITGKDGRGGFLPRHKGSKESTGFVAKPKLYKGGYNMLERTSSKRNPTRLLLAPTLTMMISYAVDNDPEVRKTLNVLEETIINEYI